MEMNVLLKRMAIGIALSVIASATLLYKMRIDKKNRELFLCSDEIKQ